MDGNSFKIGTATAQIGSLHIYTDSIHALLDVTVAGQKASRIDTHINTRDDDRDGYLPASETTRRLIRELYESVSADVAATYSGTEADHEQDG